MHRVKKISAYQMELSVRISDNWTGLSIVTDTWDPHFISLTERGHNTCRSLYFEWFVLVTKSNSACNYWGTCCGEVSTGQELTVMQTNGTQNSSCSGKTKKKEIPLIKALLFSKRIPWMSYPLFCFLPRTTRFSTQITNSLTQSPHLSL